MTEPAPDTIDPDTMYLRYRGRVTGPFSREHVDLLRDAGRLSRFHEVSDDRVNWAPALTPRASSPSTSRPSMAIAEVAIHTSNSAGAPEAEQARRGAEIASESAGGENGGTDIASSPRDISEAFISWRCDCGERLTIESAERGNRVQCPSCDALVIVPARSLPEAQQARGDDPDASTVDRARLPQRASFWSRLGATLIDAFVVATVGVAAHVVIDLVTDAESPLRRRDVLVSALVVVQWLYLGCMESSPLRATLGKCAIGLHITDLGGGGIGFGRATARHLCRFLSALPLGAGYVMIAFSTRREALHDLITRTLVVHKRPSA